MNRFCQQCGAPLEEGRFCPRCGSVVGAPPEGSSKKNPMGTYWRRKLILAAAALAVVGLIPVGSGIRNALGGPENKSTPQTVVETPTVSTPVPTENLPESASAAPSESTPQETGTLSSAAPDYAALAVEEAKAWSYTILGPETQYTYESGPTEEDPIANVGIRREGAVAAFSGSIGVMFMDGSAYDDYNNTTVSVKEGYYFADTRDGYVLYLLSNGDDGHIEVTDLWISLEDANLEEEGLMGANGFYTLQAEKQVGSYTVSDDTGTTTDLYFEITPDNIRVYGGEILYGGDMDTDLHYFGDSGEDYASLVEEIHRYTKY